MVIFPLAPDQTIAQMWSNGARGGEKRHNKSRAVVAILTGPCIIYHCATDNVTYAIRKCFADSLLIFVKYNKHCVLATEHRHTGN